MRTLVAIAMLLAGATALHAAEAPPVLVYPCERVATAPVVDGRLDDAAWEKAALVSGFTYHDRRELAPVQTAFRVVYDAEALYVGVRCEEPLWQKMTPGTPGMRDTHAAVFGGEAIEVFIDPKHNHSDYFQIAANSDGTLFDGKGTDSAWDGRARAAGRISEGGWSLEIALPWADFEVRPEPGLVIGLNICRDRNIGPNKLWSTWSPIAANFHDPLRFGHLVLSATPEMIGRLSDEFRKGGHAGPVQVFAAEGFSGTTYLALASRSLQSLDATLAELDSLCQREKSPAVAAALAKRIAAAREMAAPIAAKVKGNQAFDAAEWVRTDTQMQQLRIELEKAVWNARLEALLSGI
ncbi:MAG TPA: hypothetical protein GX715_13775 [Armatimonadetes bacterium]|jgi:hypothetical protein|nr:hypothetical protein [Armatimonadota bacterium]